MEKNMPSSDHPTSRLSGQRAARDFSRDWFVVLRGFLGEQETATARTLVESILRLPHGLACARPNNTLLPLRWNDPLVQLLLLSERRMRTLSDAVGADDLKWISGYVSIKEASSLALWWHQDWWC
jgi:hypothetical protein